jgi:antitoxin (DNA-binding transcriptional repressor) of toxin-antitoxin stability system
MKKSRRTISAAEFKAKCLALLDQVSPTGETLVVTKREAVARVVAMDDTDQRPLRGSVRPWRHRGPYRRRVGCRPVIVLDTHASLQDDRIKRWALPNRAPKSDAFIASP